MENMDTVYGRLKESAHIAGYTLSRMCQEFEFLLDEDRWKKIGQGFENINDFLATLDLSEFKISIEKRKKLAMKLDKLEASQRATAKVLGVEKRTIGRDLKDGANAPLQQQKALQTKDSNSKDGANAPSQETDTLETNNLEKENNVTSPPSIITQSGKEAATVVSKVARKEDAAEETRARREASRSATPIISGLDLRIGDARKTLSDIEEDSVHLVLTDPPYGDEARPLYVWLAKWSSRVLIKGGSLICFTGQSRLDRDIEIFSKYLRYWWLLAMRHNQAQRLPGKFVMAEFKPVLWYVKEYRRGKTLVNDVLRSDRRDKEGHDWSQGDGGVELLIEQLTSPDELIIDPFAGTGKWGQIANRMGRCWIGADIEEGGSINILA